jgi:hypothetical protein
VRPTTSRRTRSSKPSSPERRKKTASCNAELSVPRSLAVSFRRTETRESNLQRESEREENQPRCNKRFDRKFTSAPLTHRPPPFSSALSFFAYSIVLRGRRRAASAVLSRKVSGRRRKFLSDFCSSSFVDARHPLLPAPTSARTGRSRKC